MLLLWLRTVLPGVFSGEDTEMYKDAAYMKDSVTVEPFYAVQERLSAFIRPFRNRHIPPYWQI